MAQKSRMTTKEIETMLKDMAPRVSEQISFKTVWDSECTP